MGIVYCAECQRNTGGSCPQHSQMVVQHGNASDCGASEVQKALNRYYAEELARLREELEEVRTQRDEFERKGMGLCNQNADLMIQLHKAKAALREALDVIVEQSVFNELSPFNLKRSREIAATLKEIEGE